MTDFFIQSPPASLVNVALNVVGILLFLLLYIELRMIRRMIDALMGLLGLLNRTLAMMEQAGPPPWEQLVRVLSDMANRLEEMNG